MSTRFEKKKWGQLKMLGWGVKKKITKGPKRKINNQKNKDQI